MNASNWLKKAQASIHNNQGEDLKVLIQNECQTHNITRQSASLNFTLIKGDWREFFQQFFKSLEYWDEANWTSAYEYFEKAINKFFEIFQADTDWSVPVLKPLLYYFRKLAEKATTSQEQQQKLNIETMEDKSSSSMEERNILKDSAAVLMRCFSICVSDRSPLEQSKKWALFIVINNLFKIYFRLNTLSLCKNLINTVNSKSFPPFDEFPLAQRVTYRFYTGRLAIFDSNFKEALQDLQYAFTNCPVEKLKNKRLILQYLISVKLMFAQYASESLMQHYQLKEFIQLTRASKSGNLELFDQSLQQYQHFFFQQGMYLMIEKSRIVVYRNLFRKIVLMMKSDKADLKAFQIVLENLLHVSMEIEEIEAIFATLIYQGYIKGYLSHQHGKLVLMKNIVSSFPKLTPK